MQVAINNHRIQYEKFGEGPEGLLCLHGYGDTGKSFAAFAAALKSRYTLFCPDLPLHGNTRFAGMEFGPADLHQWFQAILKQEGLGEEKFSLAGFSMGGRLAICYAAQYPQQLKQLYLLAPDGLRRNPWYWLATQTLAGRRLFKQAMENPGPLFLALSFARSINLLHPTRYQFIRQALADESRRKSLFHRWMLFRKFHPDREKFRSALLKYNLPVLLFLGENDTVIPPANAKSFNAKKYPSVSRQVLPGAGHLLLQTRYIPDIAALILSQPT